MPEMSRYRGLIVLLMDVAMIFCCNFAIFLSALSTGDVRFYNLVMHIGLLTVRADLPTGAAHL